MPERDVDESVGFDLSTEDALRVLLRATEDTDVDAVPPVGGWIDVEPD